MVLITIVNGVYKPTYNWGVPPCSFMFIQFPCLLWRWSSIGWYFLRAYINQRALQHSLDLFSTLVALCPELFGLSHWLNRWHPVEVPQTFLQDQLTFRLSDIFRICSYMYIYILYYIGLGHPKPPCEVPCFHGSNCESGDLWASQGAEKQRPTLSE